MNACSAETPITFLRTGFNGPREWAMVERVGGVSVSVESAQMLVAGVGLYLAVGAVIGLFFAVWGAERIDHAATGANLWFRLLVIPGVAGLWPVMLIRLLSGRRINAPTEGGADR